MDPSSLSNRTAVEVIGLSAALIITVIYMRLSRRTGQTGAAARVNLLMAVCLLAWTIGGIAGSIVDLMPGPSSSQVRLHLLARMFENSGALGWMMPLLSLWMADFKSSSVRRLIRGLQVGVAIAAIAFFTIHLRAAWQLHPQLSSASTTFWFRSTFTSLAIPLLAVGIMLLRQRPIAPVTRLSLYLTLGGTLSLTATLILRSLVVVPAPANALLNAATEWCPLVIIMGLIIFFARFRFADRFIRQCLRLVAAAAAGISAAIVIPYLGWRWANIPDDKTAGMTLIAAGLGVSLLLLSFAALDRLMNRLVDRYIFPAPDYDRLISDLQKQLLTLNNESSLIEATCNCIRETLQIQRAEMASLSRDQLSGNATSWLCGQPVVVDKRLQSALPFTGIEMLVPIRITDDVSEVLATAPGLERHGIVTHEIGFLRAVAAQLMARLQSLQHQRVLADTLNRETKLVQQVIEAELSALRAQINPHFLFNALNTIADLIITDAERAETMTLRLAKIFRHVLAHSTRPLVSVREEMDFLRTYLHIEEARFGERLRVNFSIDPNLNNCLIPSLIFQPLVENALKHGLAPKPGPGHLWISAQSEPDRICITVEDDGMGLRPSLSLNASLHQQEATPAIGGVGLANIRQRLETLYGQHATLKVEPRNPIGTRASISLPLTASEVPR